MKIVSFSQLNQKDLERIKQRSTIIRPEISDEVRNIIREVRENGDQAIIKKYQSRYGEKYQRIKVEKKEIDFAYKNISREFIAGLRQAIKNIRLVQEAQLPCRVEKTTKPEKGIKVWREWRPIEKVGLYIPGGKAIYPSSVLMTVIPAQIAGCREIVITTPPDRTGRIPFPTLAAADMLGIKKIFKVGGAQAIAALAYGTESIPKVYKIFGAGNSFVTTAKMAVYGDVNIDMPAGPSEAFIIADETANPVFIAADLLADGEHGEDSACVLLTTSKKIADETLIEVNRQLEKLATASRIKSSLEKYGLIAIVKNLKRAIDYCNDYAPEHLEIMTKNYQQVAKKIVNAGSVFLGNWTCKASGDYATGANHVLPTGGMAKSFPPLGVDSFGKWIQVQEVNENGLKKIRQTLEVMAETEQLPAHKNSTAVRFI